MAPPTGAIPPPLPPSVEEAYRRKCQQLKRRMNEVEEGNDAAYLRVSRLRREIKKLRLERSFLLEQLSKRTPTNVEDSEGSPSPPPTPKEKPLRTKRGHRKPDFIQNVNPPAGGYSHQGTGGFLTLSPTSETFSQHQNQDSTAQARASSPVNSQPRNGHPAAHSTATTNPPPRRPKNAFDLYCHETRPTLLTQRAAEIAAGTLDVERTLAEGWQGLSQVEKEAAQQRYEAQRLAGKDNSGVERVQAATTGAQDQDVGGSKGDEDVEMGEDAGGSEAGGFTAVNRE